jgi:hypothetical protein
LFQLLIIATILVLAGPVFKLLAFFTFVFSVFAVSWWVWMPLLLVGAVAVHIGARTKKF